MKNICFFLGGFYQNGGIGRITSMIANDLTNEFNVTALCYCNTKQPNIYTLLPAVKQVYYLESYSNMTKHLVMGGVSRLKRFLVDNEIDVLIACGALFYPISVLACKGINTKCVCWEHSDPEGNSDHRGQSLARKFGIKRSDLNVVLTKRALKVFIEKYGSKNTIQIYNPIDDSLSKYVGKYNSSSHRIISVGRLSYQKNFEAAVEVASRVLKSHPDWKWEIYGKGDEKDKLQLMIDERGLSDKLILCGQVTDLYERYNNYSIMVMTSRYEGFPMSLLEGLGNGLPIISFDIPTGPDEIIDDGSNGFLIKPFEIESMANKLSFLMDNENIRNEFSCSANNKSKDFSQREIINEWSKALAQLCLA